MALRNKVKLSTETLLLFFILFQIFTFPLHRVSSTIPSILFISVSLIYIYKFKISILEVVRKNKIILFSTIYFIISLFSYFQENHFNEFINIAKLKIFFFIIPLVIISTKSVLLKNYNLIIKTINSSAFFAIIFYFTVAIFRYKQLGFNAFLYSDLVSFTNVNPIVMSILMNVIVLFIYYSDVIKSLFAKHLLILIIGAFIVMLLSKGGILIFTISYLFIIFDSLKQNKIKLFAYFAFISLSVFLFLKYQTNDTITTRINVFKYHYQNQTSDNILKKFPRVIIYECSKKIIKKNILWGVGISNTRDALKIEFKKIKFKSGIEKNYNAHNQFLETFIGSGLVGIFSILALFIHLIYYSIKQKNKLLLHFTILILFSCLLESFFESQMSVFIFLLYGCIIYIKAPEKSIVICQE